MPFYSDISVENADPSSLTPIHAKKREEPEQWNAGRRSSSDTAVPAKNRLSFEPCLQSIKKLMTFAQRRYPTMPSKAVEFNSLANGSDLQSLLAEEISSGGKHNSEERLLLMPASKDD